MSISTFRYWDAAQIQKLSTNQGCRRLASFLLIVTLSKAMQFVFRHDTNFYSSKHYNVLTASHLLTSLPLLTRRPLAPSPSHLIGDGHILRQGDTLAPAGLLPVCPRAVPELVTALRHHSIPAAVLDSVGDTLGGGRILVLLVGQEV